MVKVSVIVPVYNKAGMLKDNIKTIMNQTLTDIEIILINDGSTDNSAEICEEIQLEDSRIRVFHQDNKGVSAARNKGISEAKGEYLGFVDPDDWIETDMYENMYNKVKSTKSEACFCNYSLDKGRDRQIKAFDFSNDILEGQQITEELFLDMISASSLDNNNKTLIGSVWRQLVKKDVIVKNNVVFKEGLPIMEDLLFTLDLLTNLNKVCIDQNAYYHYVQDTGSAINQYRNNLWELYETILSEIMILLKQKNLYRLSSQRFANRCINFVFSIANNETKSDEKLSIKLRKIEQATKHSLVQESLYNIQEEGLSLNRKLLLVSLKHNKPFIVYMYYYLRQQKNLLRVSK